MSKITIFDTTLRDGEQSPGATMSTPEKLRLAAQLDSLGVDVIEAGFPVASDDDFEGVRSIVKQVRRPVIAALARAHPLDIDRAGASVEAADKPRIHVFLATSDIHLKHKLEIGREECLERVGEGVRRAKKLVDDVEFSPEDATRTDVEFLCEVTRVAVEAGATTINIPDTVGYTLPSEYRTLIETLFREVEGLQDTIVSVHCHDDLGLAVANSLAALGAGARQVECTINGIGERAGNASLEEIVMALRVRKDLTDHHTDIETTELYKTSQLLSHITGIHPQPNKAIVGRNAFSHEAGIHQHGMLKERMTYEIMTPEMVGAPGTRLVLGKHSGRHGLRNRYEELGYNLTNEELDKAYKLFTMVADQKKNILDEDLLVILHHGAMQDAPESFRLVELDVNCGGEWSTARVRVSYKEAEPREGSGKGDGPIAAAFSAIDEVVDATVEIEDFEIVAATPGRDAIGEVNLHARIGGRTFSGSGASTDVVDAAARAYINVLNKAEQAEALEGVKPETGTEPEAKGREAEKESSLGGTS
jgi:2-isopropylmalate synthase